MMKKLNIFWFFHPKKLTTGHSCLEIQQEPFRVIPSNADIFCQVQADVVLFEKFENLFKFTAFRYQVVDFSHSMSIDIDNRPKFPKPNKVHL